MTIRIPGPIDPHNYQNIDDGTLCRQGSPLPGPLHLNAPAFSGKGPYVPGKSKSHYHGISGWGVQTVPSRWDQFGISNARHYNEKWFEGRFPNTLKAAHLYIANIVFNWSIDPANKDKTIFKDEGKTKRERTRISILATDSVDRPQNNYEHNQSLGSFVIDVETPFAIERMRLNGVYGIRWKSQMYVEDVLGDPSKAPWGLKWAFPERKVIRAKWLIEVDVTDPLNPVMTFHDFQSTYSTKKQPFKWTLNPVQQQRPYLRKSGVHHWQ